MSADAKKVFLCQLRQHTSAIGRQYLSGPLEKAWLIGFPGEPTADGVPTWDIYLQPGKEQGEHNGPQRKSRAPTSSSRCGVQRWAAKAPKSPAELKPDRPFFSGDIDDLGRGE